MNWASRVKVAEIRRLYRSERRGLVEEKSLLDVGWALYALCEDVVAAVTAVHLGEVPCANCDHPLQRKNIPAPTEAQRAALLRAQHRVGWFHCEHCQSRLLWQDCRDALRKSPRCFDCNRPMKKNGANLRCACGKSWEVKKYRASVSRRVLLPCPHCNQRLRRPVFEHRHSFGGREKLPEERKYLCSKCKSKMVRAGALLTCGSCGHNVRWRSYKKSMKRRDETLVCKKCGHEFRWQEWRRKGLRYCTGNPSPAAEFLKQWPTSTTTQARMMQIDMLIQALHGQGALAPVFIEGTKESIRRLLDDLATK
jgi:hypothetical protein